MSLKWSDITKLVIVKYNGTNLEAWNEDVTQVAILAGASHILGGDYIAVSRTEASPNAFSFTPGSASSSNGNAAQPTTSTTISVEDGQGSSASTDIPTAGGGANTPNTSGSNPNTSMGGSSNPSLASTGSNPNPAQAMRGTNLRSLPGIFQPTPIRLVNSQSRSNSSGPNGPSQNASNGIALGFPLDQQTVMSPSLLAGGYSITGEFLSCGTDREDEMIALADSKLKLKLSLDRVFCNRVTGFQESTDDRYRRMILFRIMKVSLSIHQYLLTGIAIGDCRGVWTKVNTTGISSNSLLMQQLLEKLVAHHKTKSISYSEWSRILDDLFQQLGQLGAYFSESMQKGYLLSLMKDSRYGRALERIEENPTYSLGHCYTLLALRATKIGDMIAGKIPTRTALNTEKVPHSSSSSHGGKSQNSKNKQSSSKDPCFRFAVLGRCPDGDKCKREHIANASVPKADRERITKKYSSQSNGKTKKGVTDKTKSQPPSAPKADGGTPCFQFSEKGSCTFGERCKFSHAKEVFCVECFPVVEMNMNEADLYQKPRLPPPPEHYLSQQDREVLRKGKTEPGHSFRMDEDRTDFPLFYFGDVVELHSMISPNSQFLNGKHAQVCETIQHDKYLVQTDAGMFSVRHTNMRLYLPREYEVEEENKCDMSPAIGTHVESNYIGTATLNAIFDSGTNAHIFNRIEYIIPDSIRDANVIVRTAQMGVAVMTASQMGTAIISRNGHNVPLEDVLIVPDSKRTLVSLGLLALSGYSFTLDAGSIHFHKEGEYLFTVSNAEITGLPPNALLYHAPDSLFTLGENAYECNFRKAYTGQISDLELWHHRIGHVHYRKVAELLRKETGLKTLPHPPECSACTLTKITQKPHKLGHRKLPTHVLGLVVTDTTGPFVRSYRGYKYFLTFYDVYTDYACGFLMQDRKEFFAHMRDFILTAERLQQPRRLAILRTDGAPEMNSSRVTTFLRERGIRHETTASYDHASNSIAERYNRTVEESADAMRCHAGLDPRWWCYAMAHANDVHNHIPAAARKRSRTDTSDDAGSASDNEAIDATASSLPARTLSPVERWQRFQAGSYTQLFDHFRVFGCATVIYRPKETRTKNEFRGTEGMYLGQHELTKAPMNLELSSAKLRDYSSHVSNETRMVAKSALPKDTHPRLRAKLSGGPGLANASAKIDSSALMLDHYTGSNQQRSVPIDDTVVAVDTNDLEPSEAEKIELKDDVLPSVAFDEAKPSPDDQETVQADPTEINDRSSDNVEPRRRLRFEQKDTPLEAVDEEPDESAKSDSETEDKFPVGSTVMTTGGRAIITAIYEDGDLECKFPDADDPDEKYHINENEAWADLSVRYDLEMNYVTAIWVHRQLNSSGPIEINQVTSKSSDDLIGKVKAEDIVLPRFYPQFAASEHYGIIRKAMTKEWQQIVNQGTLSNLMELPDGHKAHPTLWVLKAKADVDGWFSQLKARLTLRGDIVNKSLKLSKAEAYAPVMDFATLRLLLALHCADKDVELYQVDIVAAYMEAAMRHEVYIRQPNGFVSKGQEGLVYKLLKALYGGSDSGRCFYDTYVEFHLSIGFQPIPHDQCYLQIKRGDQFIKQAFHVDDGAFIVKGKEIWQWYLDKLGKRFNYKSGQLTHFLGVKIDRQRAEGTVKLSIAAHINRVLKVAKMEDCKPTTTPVGKPDGMPTLAHYEKLSDSEKKESLKYPYREVVGALQFIEGACRPDISYALRIAAKFCSKPCPEAWSWVKRILRYLKGTADFGITIRGNPDGTMQSFTDASHAGDPDTRRSISSVLIMYAGNLIYWKQAFQQIVSHSSTESELMSLDLGVRLTQHCRWKLDSLCGPTQRKIIIFIDNQSALDIAVNPVQPGRNLHIHARYFYVRDLVLDDEIDIYYLRTEDQIADIGCAFKTGPQFLLHRSRVLKPCIVITNDKPKGVHVWQVL